MALRFRQAAKGMAERVINLAIGLHGSLSSCSALNRLSSSLFADLGASTSLQQFYWKKRSASWSSEKPPIRPSQNDLDNYQTLLSAADRPDRILLFGSTPELRNLITEKYPSSDLYIIDFSKEMHQAAAKEIRQFSESEKWINSGWMNTDLSHLSMDLVIGDVIFGQSTPETDTQLIKKIASLLAPRGCFLSRIHVSKIIPDIDAFLDDTLLTYDRTDKESRVLALLWGLKGFFADKESRRVENKKIINVLRDKTTTLYHPLLISAMQKLIQEDKNFPFKWRWAPPTEALLCNLIEPHLKITEKKYSHDYFDSECYPILLARKRPAVL